LLGTDRNDLHIMKQNDALRVGEGVMPAPSAVQCSAAVCNVPNSWSCPSATARTCSNSDLCHDTAQFHKLDLKKPASVTFGAAMRPSFLLSTLFIHT
jgi:hypothetical protein